MPDRPEVLAEAAPSKAFFIDMITRDLGLVDCILDLVDNAVDQAVLNSGVDVMEALTNGRSSRTLKGAITIDFSKSQFAISDTCGGISLDDAQHRVFLFGNPGERGAPAGLSVYGIGMKRAFFKLGRAVHMTSETRATSFDLTIDVPRWKADERNWTFPLREMGRPRHPGSTRIEISQLQPEASARMSQTSFHNELTDRIAATYSLFLRAGLRIVVRGNTIEPSLPTLAKERRLTSARHMMKSDGVDVLIITGVTPGADKRSHGWYVFCNGRMVVVADRSPLTGWGDQLPLWQPKYRHFVGYVYFHSRDVRRLPWTTTKHSLVQDSPVYQAALAEMTVQARPVISFLNNMYPGEVPAEGVIERELLQQAEAIPITKVAQKQTHFRADLDSERRRRAQELASIQYKRPVEKVKRIREVLRKPHMSNSEVGRHTFDYFIRREC